jgi:hypothetical protein
MHRELAAMLNSSHHFYLPEDKNELRYFASLCSPSLDIKLIVKRKSLTIRRNNHTELVFGHSLRSNFFIVGGKQW